MDIVTDIALGLLVWFGLGVAVAALFHLVRMRSARRSLFAQVDADLAAAAARAHRRAQQ